MKKMVWAGVALTAVILAGCGANTAQSSSATQTNPTTSPTQAVSNGTTNTNLSSQSESPVLKSQTVTLTILPGGRLGPDGKMHDTYTDPDFTVVQGVPVTLTVYNYDGGSHTLTNSDLGLNLQAKGSTKKGVPAVTTVTFTPTKEGDFKWQCMDPCDGDNQDWAMTHEGYMQGTIHVVPYANKQYVYLTIKDGLQYASADGKRHDSYSPANLTVQQGIPVQVTVENFDTGQHSITAPDLNLNQVIQGAKKDGVPTTTTFTFTPEKSGTFHWLCTIQCDGNGWAMSHDGYMAGNITVNP
ncbi:cupredoxin domain-containing protein [Alicyclobacillus sp.]|uniref:cupredoxin domain-containing protein n=1 Tax=Alicyclobacillus sp. TaxID=61169 RepID=UPI0025B85F17|nr:cupredoxin domain-containing protein [Alicyclobacillus sp.]MCL6517881.1 cupredoxin domain-containing protein [Alicyclobacillus sp.]